VANPNITKRAVILMDINVNVNAGQAAALCLHCQRNAAEYHHKEVAVKGTVIGRTVNMVQASDVKFNSSSSNLRSPVNMPH
jgi:hypothetical protein